MNRLLLTPVLLGLLASCSPTMSTSTTSPMSKDTMTMGTMAMDTQKVTIQNFAFQPKDITVKAGTSITWTNMDTAPHTATASDGSFNTGNLTTGQSASVMFTKAGDYAYFCAVHPKMVAMVHVTAP
jgi:plastocyanin